MRKFLTILCAMLLTAQFTVAQKNLYVISKTGELTYYPTTKVFFDYDLFTFTYGEVTEITKESFTASVNVELNSSENKSFNQALEVGVCFSDANTTPTIKDGKIIVGTSLGNNTFSICGLDAGYTYYYRAYVKINDVVYYGDVRNETTFGKKTVFTIDGHRFVDLGLPSGILWAETNIGAKTAADNGYYYAWGETEPQTSNSYYWDSYKYGTSSSNFTKYNSSDGKTILDSEDDAAYVNWGSSCRMPTKTEFAELYNTDNCTLTLTSKRNSFNEIIKGFEVTSIKNGNSIFLPASGHRYESSRESLDWAGEYWSSTLLVDGDDTSCAYELCFLTSYFSNGYSFGYRSNGRIGGSPVRPVAEQ